MAAGLSCSQVGNRASGASGRRGIIKYADLSALAAISASADTTSAISHGEVSEIFERFTERARQIVVLAQDEARQLKHNYIGTEHILLGILREQEGLANRVLAEFGITQDHLRAWIKDEIGEGDEVITGQLPFTPRAKKILEFALREALSLGHNYIGTEHVLLGLVREVEGAAHEYLEAMEVTAQKVRDNIVRQLSSLGGRRPVEPADQIRIAIRSIQQGIQSINRGLNSLEAALEQEMPKDPDEDK